MLKKLALSTVMLLLIITIFATTAVPGDTPADTPVYSTGLHCDISRCATANCYIIALAACVPNIWLDYSDFVPPY